ncbi:hypothetical protein Godav_027973 [Gossypium davidsonii]|uniref:Uncharacterized protein n=1 Tax=Gossypium davidsonii TaxID=34287 RepID=A0A7J8RYN7_GOSDV|nr:hypothetical protein [Gossypium davidsonii]
MDGPVVTGSIFAADWRDICKQLLGRVLDTIYGAQIDLLGLMWNCVKLKENNTLGHTSLRLLRVF